MKGVLFAAQIEGIRSRKDRTVSITLGTQELAPDKAAEIFSLNQKMATAYLTAAEEIPQQDQEIIDTIEPDLPGKSPSQRVRAILFLLWKQNNEGFKDKNLHYLHHMEKIIDHLKSKIKD